MMLPDLLRWHGSAPLAKRLLYGLVILVLALITGLEGLAPATARANTCQNLIENGGMESDSGWVTQTNGSYSLFSDYQVRSGSRAAYLAGIDNAEDRLTHSLSLPAGQKITLSFWWLVTTEEIDGGWDGLSVLLLDANGHPLRVLFSLSDRSAADFWQQSTVDLSQFAGESVQLQFFARTDDTLATDFFVDDVTLTACETSSASQWIYLPTLRR